MKRTLCSLLLLCCLLADLLIPVSASGDMATSTEGIAFIEEMQNGSTYNLSEAEAAVNSFISKYDLSLKQTQFDALVDFVIAYNANILSQNYRIETLIGGDSYTDAELASAFCSWVKGSDGTVSETNLRRRLREIKLFLYDSYDGNCQAQFRYVLFNANFGTLDDNSVICYPLNETYANLPAASRSGYYFAGWYTTATGGTQLRNIDTVTQNYTVYAHWSETKVNDPNVSVGATEFVPPVLKVSESCISFIKAHEGFSQYAYWDYSQYTIGYGTACDPADYPNGITEAEADYWLRVKLKEFEETVDKVLAKGTVEHTQNQYDAIMSFTFNLGSQWMKSSNKIYQYILFGNHTEMEFVNSIGAWANAGGSVVKGLMRRRMDEADMYLNGNYERFSKTYFGVELNGNGGTPQSKCYYYRAGEPLGILPTATREGYELIGWYGSSIGGMRYTEESIASTGTATIYACWEEISDEEPESTEPTESETESTEPTESETESTEPTEPVPNEGFTDIDTNAWYYSYVLQAVEQGLFSGMNEASFCPDGTMTRAMLVTVLHRLCGEPEAAGETPFADLDAERWYYDAVCWAYENGIVNGVSDTVFGVNEPITREQLTTMLYRYAAKQYDVSERGDLSSFGDADNISNYASEPMQWAVAVGILNGSGGNLLPRGNATRAQCAKMMVIFAELFPQS